LFEISWITPQEYVSLISTFWSINDKEYNCAFCKKKQSQSVRDSRKFCSVKKESPVVTYQNIKYFTCPSNFYNSGTAQLIDMFRHFRLGVLPFEGGLFDQPSKLIDCFNLLENLTLELQKDQTEKAQKWQKAQSRSNYPLKNKKL